MAKFELKIDIEKMNLYEMKEILKLILEKVNLELDETEIKPEIKKHFKEK